MFSWNAAAQELIDEWLLRSGLGGQFDTAVAAGGQHRPVLIGTDASADYVTVFDCDGAIMHQSYQGAVESSLTFWFGVHEDETIDGVITEIGDPLDLPQREITGKLSASYNNDGAFTGGRMTVDWPYANDGRPVQIALMRETFIRSGPRVNGVARILRRTSAHTYLAGTLWFDPASHPSLSSFYRISFIAATCFPSDGLPPLAKVK